MLPDVNYLDSTEFLIRAKPEKIGITESYEQKVEQDIAVKEAEGKEPEGKIEIVVPYDGADSFGKLAEYDGINHEVHESVWSETEELEVRGRIGYIYFRDAGKTDLKGQLQEKDLWSREQVMPLEVTLRDVRGWRFHRLISDEYSCKLHINYKPDLKKFPVALKLVEDSKDKTRQPKRFLHISDEEQIINDVNKWSEDNEILSRLRRQSTLSDQYEIPLLIELKVLFLPSTPLTNDPLKIEFQIDCPTFESESAIVLGMNRGRSGGDDDDEHNNNENEGDENEDGESNDEADEADGGDGGDGDSKDGEEEGNDIWETRQHRIEDGGDDTAGYLAWGGIALVLEPFEPTDEKPEREDATYRSAKLRLLLKEPVMFRGVKTLRGRVKCQLGWACSGVDLLYFDAYGNVDPEMSSSVTAKSSVEIGFDIHLERFSQDKLSVPYQRFHFADVRFEEDRVDDLIKILRELAFEFDVKENSRKTHVKIDKEREAHEPTFTILQNENDAEKTNGRLIHVKQMIGEREIALYIHIYGFQMMTTRERHAHAGQDKYTSDRPTGQTVVDMGGSSYGDSKRLVAMMNTIHDGLKALFEHVSSGA